ncbi:MAG TPA: FAD-dependent oxidoreductase, partial [Candidatus Acidoferrales bacterium]|nr:FAD-dependent oxidoreductase [Candidatus Acidoferrales bacterium]
FLRDFRGDTVHPSTMAVLDELGLLDDFLARPHSELRTIGGKVGRDYVTIGDFSHLPAKTNFIAIMPQWDFLNFLSERGCGFPSFTLLMSTAAESVIEERDRVVGVRASGPDGDLEIRADLTVACDGRHSTIRDLLHVQPIDLGAPMDVLWFRISRDAGDPESALGYIGAGAILVMIDRNDYWQCGYVIPKGTFEEIKGHGLDELRGRVGVLAPFLGERLHEIRDWDNVKLLSVAVDRLSRWYRPGVLFIGDAAHAMSPVGGVGINLAIQDAVASANILSRVLRRGRPVREAVLRRVQRRREWPTKMTQSLQVFVQKRIVSRVLAGKRAPKRAPALLALLGRLPILQRIPARIVGIGFRPEHVRLPRG